MRIALIVPVVPPTFDGIGDYAYFLAREMRKAGQDARIVTSSHQTVAEENRDWIHPLVDRWSAEGVLRALQKREDFKPDWVIFQYAPQMYGRSGLCWNVSGISASLKRQGGYRVAVTFHEIFLNPHKKIKRWFLSEIMKMQARKLLGPCDLAVTTCRRLVENLESLKRNDCSVRVQKISSGCTIDFIPAAKDEISALRSGYGFEKALVLGGFGRLTHERDFGLPLQMLREAKQRGQNVFLLWMGKTAAQQQTLEKLCRQLGVEGRVKMTGGLSSRELTKHFQLIDLFVYLQDDGIATGNSTVMTALAHNLPIFSYEPYPGNFDEDPIPELKTVQRNHPKIFVTAAVDYLLQMKDRERQAGRNRDYFRDHFDWPVIRNQYMKVLETD